MATGFIPHQIRTIEDAEVLGLVHAWILGDKYGINMDFQDCVILELMHWATKFDSASPEWGPSHDLRLSAARVAFENTMFESQLRKLMAEVLVHVVQGVGSSAYTKLSALDNAPDALADYLHALDRVLKCNADTLGEERRKNRWRDFMVGEGPLGHWVYSPFDEQG